MRKSLGLVSAAALVVGLAMGTSSPNGMVRRVASQMVISKAQAAAAINGSINNYAVIAPTFYTTTSTGQESYIRLFNGAGVSGNTSTFSLQLVGNKSGQTYGAAVNFKVPHMGSIQLDIKDIVSLAGATLGAFTAGSGDTGYSVYVQNADAEAGYQHAVYDWGSGLFENVSICDTLINEQMNSIHKEIVVTNLHSSLIPNFPSTLEIHNYYNAPITLTLTAFNAGNRSGNAASTTSGKLTCQFTLDPIAANSTMVLTEASIEAKSQCVIDSDENYINVVLADQSGVTTDAIAAHLLFVSKLNGSTSMTNTCAVNKVTTTGTTTGGGTVITSPYL